ncbi:EpsG family protein [Kaistella flava (ex Peng et al. 2021)]|uniref:EpsG family protein n=2 Tax=Kaistella flava (ex Peng et al. 2021) TaxID=2038776 RepID=A0A7M2YB39_9FLAO|nr:EpsG family protein [Kaistella flava (ex Peng et al. 2021)]
MEVLHPLFTIVFLGLIGFSFLEVYGKEIRNFKAVWIIIIVMIILSGLRNWVGADYQVYFQMYSYYGLDATFSEIFDKALFRKSNLEIEWLYLFFNNLFFSLGFPFYVFTLFVAIFAIVPKFYTIEKNVAYPAFSVLLYLIPTYFVADAGQIRQGLGMAVCIFAFKFIKERNLPMFLLMIYIALGFHKSTIIFLPAYWLVLIPMSSSRILTFVAISAILAPFQIYNSLGFLDSIAPQEVYAGYSGYVSIENAEGRGIGLLDLIIMLYVFYLVFFNKVTCAKIPYYEYMRNLGVIGICLYFILRGSPIFSTRLSGIYLFFIYMALPNIVASIEKVSLKRYLHFVLVCFMIFYYFVFSHYQAKAGRFTPDTYQNYLW